MALIAIPKYDSVHLWELILMVPHVGTTVVQGAWYTCYRILYMVQPTITNTINNHKARKSTRRIQHILGQECEIVGKRWYISQAMIRTIFFV